MKKLTTLLLLLFSITTYAGGLLQEQQSADYNFQNCTQTSVAYNNELNISNFIFDCPKSIRVLLWEDRIQIQNTKAKTITDNNCEIDELFNDSGLWGMNVECVDPEIPPVIPTITLEWTNCTLIGTESSRINPKARILHCEDTNPPNDDYFIYLKNTLMYVDDGNSELREYYGCNINYLDTLIHANHTSVKFKTTCWND